MNWAAALVTSCDARGQPQDVDRALEHVSSHIPLECSIIIATSETKPL